MGVNQPLSTDAADLRERCRHAVERRRARPNDDFAARPAPPHPGRLSRSPSISPSSRPRPLNETFPMAPPLSVSSLLAVPADPIGNIFSFLQPCEQASLRSTCSAMITAFNGAVRNELLTMAASHTFDATEYLHDTDEETEAIRWFPVTYHALTTTQSSQSSSSPMLVQHVVVFDLEAVLHTRSLLPLRGAGDQIFCGLSARSMTILGFGGFTAIGDEFLSLCQNLVTVRIGNPRSPNARLERIGHNFLWNCTQLRAAVFTDVLALESVGSGWLSCCRALQEFAPTGLRSLSTVGSGWLDSCTALTTVRFTGSPALVTVGDRWLNGCTSLTHVDFSALRSLETTGDNFLAACCSLRALRFDGLEKLEQVGSSWLNGCAALSEVSFDALRELTTVGHNWLAYCRSLTSIRFAGLRSLTSVADNWMFYCDAVSDVRFDGLARLERIGSRCMYHCVSLEQVDLSPLVELRVVGAGWMESCERLSHVDFHGLSHLSKVNEGWLRSCSSLVDVNFDGLTALQTVEHSWLARCPRLRSVDMSGLRSLQDVGGQLLSASGPSVVGVSLAPPPQGFAGSRHREHHRSQDGACSVM
jgi:hypothetical protein